MAINKSDLKVATDPTTPSKRLEEIYAAKPELGRHIANNPNADIPLLTALAVEYPIEVYGNKGLEAGALKFGKTTIWSSFPLKSILAIVLSRACQHDEPCLLQAARFKLDQALRKANDFVEVTAKEDWHFRRDVLISPGDVKDLIQKPIELKATQIAHMACSHQIYLECAELLKSSETDQLSSLLQLVSAADVEGIVSSPLNSGGDDLSMDKPEFEEDLFSCSDKSIKIRGDRVELPDRRKLLFRLRISYCSGADSDPVLFAEKTLTIPIGDKNFSIETRELSIDPGELGELGTLWGWTPAVLPHGLMPENWPEWLAHALCDESR